MCAFVTPLPLARPRRHVTPRRINRKKEEKKGFWSEGKAKNLLSFLPSCSIPRIE
jgi:hypothetical protein